MWYWPVSSSSLSSSTSALSRPPPPPPKSCLCQSAGHHSPSVMILVRELSNTDGFIYKANRFIHYFQFTLVNWTGSVKQTELSTELKRELKASWKRAISCYRPKNRTVYTLQNLVSLKNYTIFLFKHINEVIINSPVWGRSRRWWTRQVRGRRLSASYDKTYLVTFMFSGSQPHTSFWCLFMWHLYSNWPSQHESPEWYSIAPVASSNLDLLHFKFVAVLYFQNST